MPGELHGQRSLTGYSPWGCKVSDPTESLTHTHTIVMGRSITTLRLKGARRKGNIRGKLSRLADTEARQVVTSGRGKGGRAKQGIKRDKPLCIQ